MVPGAVQFVEKEPDLASGVIRALLRFWPLVNSQKEVRRRTAARLQAAGFRV